MYNTVEVIELTIREMRSLLGDTQSEFASRYSIPFRTIQNWETEKRKPPEYLIHLLSQRVQEDLVNRKTVVLPVYDQKKINLPKRTDYVGAISWLKAVQDCISEPIVFALDEALMCQGLFGGRSNEYVIWAYANDAALQYNGVVILGNKVSPYCVEERSGLRFTDFNRTLTDALTNEPILDMQGITEAVSRYYFKNGESFKGLSVSPEYQEQFEKLAQDAINYYTY